MVITITVNYYCSELLFKSIAEYGIAKCIRLLQMIGWPREIQFLFPYYSTIIIATRIVIVRTTHNKSETVAKCEIIKLLFPSCLFSSIYYTDMIICFNRIRQLKRASTI